MVDVVLQNAWALHCINKDEGGEFLLLLSFRRDVVFYFSEILKRRQIVLKPCKNSKRSIRSLFR